MPRTVTVFLIVFDSLSNGARILQQLPNICHLKCQNACKMPSLVTLNVIALASVGKTNQTETILLMSFYTSAMLVSVKMPAKGQKCLQNAC